MIEHIFDWISSLLTLEPITTITVYGLLNLYMQYLILGIFLSLPLFVLAKGRKSDVTATEISILVPVEEFIFRGVPIWFIGGPVAPLIAHLLFGLLHGVGCIFVLVHALLYLRLWLGGLWLIAIGVHLSHDLLLLGLVRLYEKRREQR